MYSISEIIRLTQFFKDTINVHHYGIYGAKMIRSDEIPEDILDLLEQSVGLDGLEKQFQLKELGVISGPVTYVIRFGDAYLLL